MQEFKVTMYTYGEYESSPLFFVKADIDNNEAVELFKSIHEQYLDMDVDPEFWAVELELHARMLMHGDDCFVMVNPQKIDDLQYNEEITALIDAVKPAMESLVQQSETNPDFEPYIVRTIKV